MSYEGNDLGYDTGYDTDFIPLDPAKELKRPALHELAYSMAGEAQTVAPGSKRLYIPSDLDSKDGSSKVRALKDGQVKEYASEAEAQKDGAQAITVQLEGQKGGMFLLQYKDWKGNSIKYDQVDGKTAEKFFSKEELNKAPKIQDRSFAADQLKKLESSEDKKAVNLDPGTPTVSVSEAQKKNGEVRWQEGGSYHTRLKEYNFTDGDIAFIQKEYGQLPTAEQDKIFSNDGIFPPLKPEEKASQKLQDERKKGAIDRVINDRMDRQADDLMAKANTDPKDPKKKLTEKDAAFLDKPQAKLMINQFYRESGFDPDQTPKNFDTFKSDGVQKGVKGKIDGVEGGRGKSSSKVEAKMEDAKRAEHDALINDVAGQMPDKITKKVNGQDKEVKLSKEDKYSYAQVYVQEKVGKGDLKTAEDFKKERERLKARGVEQNKKDLRAYVESFHTGPDGEKKLGDLKAAAGQKEDYTAGLDAKQKKELAMKDAEQKQTINNEEAKAKREAEAEGIKVEGNPNWRKDWEDLKQQRAQEAQSREKAKAAGVEYKPGWELEAKTKEKEIENAFSKDLTLYQNQIQFGFQQMGNLMQNTVASAFKMMDRSQEIAWKGLDSVSQAGQQQLAMAAQGAFNSLWGGAKKA